MVAEADTDLASLQEMTGFAAAELRNLLPPEADPDAVVVVPAAPVTQPGDFWTLGRHRLLCGDATAEEDVDRLLDGGQPRLMVTDPPYGVEYDADWRNFPETMQIVA